LATVSCLSKELSQAPRRLLMREQRCHVCVCCNMTLRPAWCGWRAGACVTCKLLSRTLAPPPPSDRTCRPTGKPRTSPAQLQAPSAANVATECSVRQPSCKVMWWGAGQRRVVRPFNNQVVEN
jgi:hypothetical protein